MACGYTFLHHDDYLSYQTPWVRDIVWLLTPSLNLPVEIKPYTSLELRVPSLIEQKTLKDWFVELDRLQQPPLHCNSSRLGFYFETLVTYFLTHNPIQPFRVLEKNYPLYTYSTKGKSTSGELDLLLTDSQGQLLHLELSVKFYLRTTPHSTHWLGPNTHDELSKKLVRMREHQLRLGRRITLDSGLNLPESASVYWIKGYLLEPLGSDWTGASGWIYLSQLAQLSRFVENQCHILEKQYWLGAYSESQECHKTTVQEISHRLTQNNCVMLGLFDDSPHTRIMVVNDNWPKLT